MTDKEYAAEVRRLLAAPEEPKDTGTPPAPSMVREPKAKSDEELGLETGPIKRPEGSTATQVGREVAGAAKRSGPQFAREALNAVGTSASDAIDAATGGTYTPTRNAIADKVSPGTGAATAADEAAFNAAHPIVDATSRAVGSMSPVGAPAAEARILEATASPVVSAGKALLRKAAAGAADRIAARTEQDVARGASKAVKERLMPIAPGDIASTAREFGITGKDPGAVREGIKQVSAAMQPAYQTVEATGGNVGQGAIDDALKQVEERWGKTVATKPMAKEVADLREELAKKFKAAGGPTPRELQDEITALSRGAFGGSYANPTVGKVIERETTRALKGALDEHLDTVAEIGGPEADAAVTQIRALNKKMQVLKTLEPATKDAARAERFPPEATRHGPIDLHHAIIPAGVGGAVGATAGGLVAGFPGAVAGGALGAAAHAGGKAAARAVDARLAALPAERFAAAGVPRETLTPSPAMQVAQPVLEAITRGDPEAAKHELARAVAGP